MAAAKTGHRAQINLFPDGVPGEYLDGRRMAQIVFEADAGAKTDPLFEHVLDRRTDRRAYDVNRTVSGEEIAALSKAASAYNVRFGVEAGDKIAAIREIAKAAWYNELTTEGPMMESVRVLRVGTAEIDAHRDGISIVNPFLVIIERFGLFDRTRMPAADSQAVRAQVADFSAITEATPAYLWIITDGNSRQEQVAAGSAYVRVNLAGTALGLSMHPNQQALQEFPEVAEQHAAIHALLGASSPGNTVQMLARLGRVRIDEGPVSPSPRRELPIS
jgi:hypothetical protein